MPAKKKSADEPEMEKYAVVRDDQEKTAEAAHRKRVADLGKLPTKTPSPTKE